MIRRRLLRPFLAALLTLAAAPPGRAAAPDPLPAARVAFPGAVENPADALGAGLALANRWLGDTPGDNPAFTSRRGVALSPEFLRVSRQDLSAANRDYRQTFGFVDGAGGALAVPAGTWRFALYATQPSLRLESEHYTEGRVTDPAGGAQIAIDVTTRETRAGLAVSKQGPAWQLGAALELTHRDDDYRRVERSGSPEAGTREATLHGDAFGGVLGARWQHAADAPGGVVAGAALRWTGALDATGDQVEQLLVSDTTLHLAATRDAQLEFGGSARVTLSPESHAYASLGMRGREAWPAFDVRASGATRWAVGVDYHDAELPWTVRMGLGQDVEPGTPEPRALRVGAGVGWKSGDTIYELGILHRGMSRAHAPHLADERFVATVRVPF